MTNLTAKVEFSTTNENAARDTIAYMLNDANPYVTAAGTPLVVLVEIEDAPGETEYVVVSLRSNGTPVADMDIESGDALAEWKKTLPATTDVVDIECFTVTTPGAEKATPKRTPSRLLVGVAYQLR